MKVDYSRLEREDKNSNWFGPISFNDGNIVKDITVEIQPGNCADIPKAAKKVLEFFFDNYSNFIVSGVFLRREKNPKIVR